MNDLAELVRRTNSILLLALGPQIRANIEEITTKNAQRVIVGILMAREELAMETAQLLAEAKIAGIGRTQAFVALGELERVGVVERPRRGFVAIANVARPFVVTHARGGMPDQEGASETA